MSSELYDRGISKDVPLYRILDEMLMDEDGYDLATVEEFLKSHEDQVPAMFIRSAFVFRLYDLVESQDTSSITPFLVRHMPYLNDSDSMFASFEFGTWLSEVPNALDDSGVTDADIAEARLIRSLRPSEFDSAADYFSGHARYYRNSCQNLLIRPTGTEFMVSASDVRTVMKSNIARSLCMGTTFLRHGPAVQLEIVDFLARKTTSRDALVYEPMVESLVRQLLLLDHADIAEWTANVFRARAPSLFHMTRSVGHSIAVRSGLRMSSSQSFADAAMDHSLNPDSDGTDVMLWALLASPKMLSEMAESPDIVDMLDLPFDWRKMECMKRCAAS